MSKNNLTTSGPELVDLNEYVSEHEQLKYENACLKQKLEKCREALEEIHKAEGSVTGVDKNNIDVDADYELGREELQLIARATLNEIWGGQGED